MRTVMIKMLWCAAACLVITSCEMNDSETTGTVPETAEPGTTKPAEVAKTPESPEQELPKLTVTSTAFEHGQPIPVKYTCNAEDVSPPLSWTEGPEGTKTYALIFEDPDAPSGNWVHWIAWNMQKTSLEENASKRYLLSKQAGLMYQGKNSWDKPMYQGPCPPSGMHHYYIRVYALDTKLRITTGLDKEILVKAMNKHILAYGELMGTYERK